MTIAETPKSGGQPDLPGSYQASNNAREETIRVDVARRLRKACSHLTDEAFAVLVAKIAAVQLKAERRSVSGGQD